MSLSLEGAARGQRLHARCKWFIWSTAAASRLSDQPSHQAPGSLPPAEDRGSSWGIQRGIQRGIVGYVESWIPALGRNFMRKRVASGREQPLEGDPILGPEESARKAIKKPDGMPLVLVRVVSRFHLAPAGLVRHNEDQARQWGGVRLFPGGSVNCRRVADEHDRATASEG